MDCHAALLRLNADLDGEPSFASAAERADLEAHLASCGDCRAAAAGLRLDSAALRRAFAPRRAAAADIAHRVTDQLAGVPPSGGSRSDTAPVPESRLPDTARRPLRTGWLPLLAAAAAGFLLAVLVFRPWRGKEPILVEVERPIAHLAVASGLVEFQPPRALAFMTCPSDTPLPAGASVRTGPDVRCELSIADGPQVRLNADTQVVLHEDRPVELSQGQLWSSVSQGQKPFSVRAAEATVVAHDCQFDLSCSADETILTVVSGSAQVRGSADERTVVAGQQVSIVGGQVGQESPVSNAIVATSWIDQILVLKGPDDPELAQRLDELLASVGQAKVSFLYEDEIRRLGDHAVLPLLRYLQSPRSTADPPRRVVAARIVADVAQPRWIPDLIDLLADEDPEVRYHAAAGLKRLTARDQGLPPDSWQSQPWTSCQPAHQSWLDWWQQNKARYPAGARPAPPAFKKG